MWRITPEGRRCLQRCVKRYGSQRDFCIAAPMAKNQMTDILRDPDHTIRTDTLEKLRSMCNELTERTHYESVTDDDGCRIHLARDRDPHLNLTRHDQKAIQRLYEALWKNPRFKELRPALDSPRTFNEWFDVWGNTSHQMPSEQFFVYKIFRNKVISFLFGERHLRSPDCPYELFAIWYLVGVENAFYDGSPVGLDDQDEKALPLGEQESAVSLGLRLLEELREERTISFITIEVEASQLKKPDSYVRKLFRVYYHVEERLRQHFKKDTYLDSVRFYVLDFPYVLPVVGERNRKVAMVPHCLICCPMKDDLVKEFQKGAVSPLIVKDLLRSLYQMYFDYFDEDSPVRDAVKEEISRAEREFEEAYVRTGLSVPCYTLGAFIRSGFGRGKPSGNGSESNSSGSLAP